jgi:hypothetical protein
MSANYQTGTRATSRVAFFCIIFLFTLKIMKPKHEIYGNLARLLATENLDIVHKNVETASFNVDSRTLTLPIWDKASDTVYQLLLSHEAGHAIYTSTEDWSKLTDVPMQFLNVTEDVRIEKLMKRRYPGLKKTFFNGYKELNDEDFFGIADDDITEYNFADKVNLYFKIGNFINLQFTEIETKILDQIQEAETFTDAIKAAEVLYEYCKNEESKIDNITNDLKQSGSLSSDYGESQQQTQGEEINSESPSSDDNKKSSSNNDIPNSSKEDANTNEKKNNDYDSSLSSNYIKTANSFSKAVNNLRDNDNKDIAYLEVPKLNLDQVVVKTKKIHSLCQRYWDEHSDSCDFSAVDADYIKFKNSAKNEVNYLVKEFECKKAADAYSKSSESKTGVLDCSSLYSYKYNEDIFKKIITVPEGKNHGLIFILDWSGSMDTVILETCRQLFNLIWFCKRSSIPFEVYAFTNSWSYSYGKCLGAENDTILVDGNFNLLNFISSSVNSTTLEQHMKNMYRLAYYFSQATNYNIPSQLSLSGTPLNETMIALHQIIPEFQKKTKVQKVQCVVLTDGEASALNRVNFYEGKKSSSIIGDNCFLRDKNLKTTYNFPRYSYYASHKFTDVLLKHLKDVFPSVNFIGIRLLTNGEIVSFVKQHMEDCTLEQHGKIMSDWKKYKSCSLTLSGYDCYFGIHSSSLGNNSEFEVSGSPSIVDIRNAFKKSLQSKKMNKKILSKFVDLIA